MSDEVAKQAPSPHPAPAPPTRHRPRAFPGETLSERDINGDGAPDAWVYSVQARKVRQELDIDGDGRVDLTTFYDAREEHEREVLDRDFDGRVDSVFHYEKGLPVRRELDSNGDGQLDAIEEWVNGRAVTAPPRR